MRVGGDNCQILPDPALNIGMSVRGSAKSEEHSTIVHGGSGGNSVCLEQTGAGPGQGAID